MHLLEPKDYYYMIKMKNMLGYNKPDFLRSD